jgi:hypothetical protein
LFCAAVSNIQLLGRFLCVCCLPFLMPFSMVVVFDVSWRDATVLLSERHNYADRMVVV